MRRALLLAGATSCVLHGVICLLPGPRSDEARGGSIGGGILQVRLQSRPRAEAPTVVGAVAMPAPAPQHATPTRRGRDETGAVAAAKLPEYWPAETLDRQPMPVSAPDAHGLTGSSLPDGTVRLRLSVDAEGVVRQVEVLSRQEFDWSALVNVFAATRFIPGQRGGQNVPCRFDIEVAITDLLRLL